MFSEEVMLRVPLAVQYHLEYQRVNSEKKIRSGVLSLSSETLFTIIR